MEELGSKQLLVIDEEEVDVQRGRQREKISCCRLWYSLFVLVIVCTCTFCAFMVLMDLFSLQSSDGGNTEEEAYVIFGEYNVQQSQHDSSQIPTLKHSSAIKKYDPPFFTEKAKRARYLVHYSDWTTVSTMSVHHKGAPFGVVQSISDGPTSNSSGIPYLYIAKIAYVWDDIRVNPVVALSFSEAQTDYCTRHLYDAEDPRCARLCLTGKIMKVPKGSEEEFARLSLFSRHPSMKHWPKSHGFMFLKLEIISVWLVDFFGGPTEIPIKDYFDAKP